MEHMNENQVVNKEQESIEGLNTAEYRKPSLGQAIEDALQKSASMKEDDDEKKTWLNKEISRIILDEPRPAPGSPDGKILNDLFTLTEEGEFIITYQKYQETLQNIINDIKKNSREDSQG